MYTLQEYKMLAWLTAEYIVHWYERDDKNIIAYVNLNDTFAWGCADGEDIVYEPGCDQPIVEDLYNMCRQWGEDGAYAWAAAKRDQMPLKELQTEDFKAAFKWLIDKYHA